MTTTVIVAPPPSLHPPQNQPLPWRLSLFPPNAAFCSLHLTKNNNKKKSMSLICAHSLPFDLSPPPIDHDFLVIFQHF